jgi:hypothetical protein
VTGHRRFMIEYAQRWPISFIVTVFLTFYGVFAMVDQLTGGLATLPLKHFLFRVIGCSLAAAAMLLINRRAGRSMTYPAA